MICQMNRIIPGEAIGAVRIAMQEETLVELLETGFHVENRSEICRVYHEKSRHTWVDVTTKRVYQITAAEGYAGLLFGRIGIGSKLDELKGFGKVYCTNDPFPTYLVRGMDGICFEIKDSESRAKGENETIAYITVFADDNEGKALKGSARE